MGEGLARCPGHRVRIPAETVEKRPNEQIYKVDGGALRAFSHVPPKWEKLDPGLGSRLMRHKTKIENQNMSFFALPISLEGNRKLKIEN